MVVRRYGGSESRYNADGIFNPGEQWHLGGPVPDAAVEYGALPGAKRHRDGDAHRDAGPGRGPTKAT